MEKVARKSLGAHKTGRMRKTKTGLLGLWQQERILFQCYALVGPPFLRIGSPA